ncbi:MAG: endo-1,4-beta-xylanase [Gammaproteobacteria bacterium]
MTMTRRQALTLLAGASALPASFAFAQAASNTEPSLKELGKRKGLRIGNAIANAPDRFGDPAYRALMARECNVIVCENETKWQALEPRQGHLNFGPADEMFKWAKGEGMQIRGHTLFWFPEKWLPAWVNQYDFGADGAGAAKRAEALLAKHIKEVTQHYGRDIYSYDVVNEAVDPATGEMRENVFGKRLGAVETVDLAFRLARENAPHAQLVYNDYMRGDAGSAKHRAGVLKMLHALKTKGAPIDAVGLQSHIGSWDDVKGGSSQAIEWRKFLDEVTGMGYKLLITEFDVNDRELPGDIKRRDAGVAALAKDYLDLTLSYPQVTDFLMWGMADHVSWLKDWDEAPRKDKLMMRGTPYDEKLRAKPLRAAIAESLKKMPARA